jgi:hypothetical protein
MCYTLTTYPSSARVKLRSGKEAGATGLEPAASGVTGRRSNQLNYAPAKGNAKFTKSLTPFQAIRNLQRNGVTGPLYLLQTLDKRTKGSKEAGAREQNPNLLERS